MQNCPSVRDPPHDTQGLIYKITRTIHRIEHLNDRNATQFRRNILIFVDAPFKKLVTDFGGDGRECEQHTLYSKELDWPSELVTIAYTLLIHCITVVWWPKSCIPSFYLKEGVSPEKY
ncbi:jg22824 [Pararge aegeria aegeria]|uniref:Jg22824 protein n=1 Tax=Pararge aegeria aegeria TaxID=348720 RepID=A0A8S4RX03_9NEOP|nr:jg22824 [Pararge aegeria aegeria]